MLTQVIEGIVPLACDNQVLRACREQADRGPSDLPIDLEFAVLNHAGELYRVIGAQSEEEAAGISRTLSAIGLFDRVMIHPTTYQPVDAVTSDAIPQPWSGVFQQGRAAHPIPAVPHLQLAPVPP